MRRLSESDRKFALWASAFWIILLTFMLFGCASAEKQESHEPPNMMMLPEKAEDCDPYLTKRDIEFMMRLNNYVSCHNTLEFRKMEDFRL